MRIEFHCGRCRLRHSIEASDGADLTLLDRLQAFVVESHRELSPHCTAGPGSVQLLSITPTPVLVLR